MLTNERGRKEREIRPKVKVSNNVIVENDKQPSKKSCIPYLSSLRCDQVLEPFVRAGIVSFQPSRIRHSGASTAAAATTGTPRQHPSDASASTNATATAEALLAPVKECVERYFEMHRQGDPLAPTWVVLVDADEFLGGGAVAAAAAAVEMGVNATKSLPEVLAAQSTNCCLKVSPHHRMMMTYIFALFARILHLNVCRPLASTAGLRPPRVCSLGVRVVCPRIAASCCKLRFKVTVALASFRVFSDRNLLPLHHTSCSVAVRECYCCRSICLFCFCLARRCRWCSTAPRGFPRPLAGSCWRIFSRTRTRHLSTSTAPPRYASDCRCCSVYVEVGVALLPYDR